MLIILELQKTGNTLAHLLTTHESRDEAESKYHTVLSAAAVSSVNVHSAVMLDDTGRWIKGETYYHGGEA
jgi:hypothetical protein